MARQVPPHAADDCAPMIVRVAGLPLTAVQCFASDLCAGMGERAALEARLDSVRAEAVDRLHAAVPKARPELRRFLLAVKRDCHNARPIHQRAEDARWSELRERIGPLADRVVELEREAADFDARFEARFAAELGRQRQALLESLDNRGFLRGLALASPDLFDAIRRLRDISPADYSRKEQKAEMSLLRYVTRAAVKVSPFSTFTMVALGTVCDDPGLRGVRLDGEPWRTRSLVRIKRYLLHRVADLLCRYEPFRERLPVEMNDSLSETSPCRFLFLRPHHWELDAERSTLRYQKDALVAVNLEGALIARASELLDGERPTYAEMIETLRREFSASDADGVRQHVDQLLHLGVLQFLMPWPAHEGHLEKRMLEYLRTLPGEPTLDVLVERLGCLVALEERYAVTNDPVESVRAMDRAIDQIGEAAAPLAGLEPSAIRTPRTGQFSIYEDVFLRPSDESGRALHSGIADVPRSAVKEALRNAELLVRLSILRDHRQDFQHTLAAIARERWPEREGMGVLQVFQEVKTLWHDYMRVHVSHWRDHSPEVKTWNPLGLPELEVLHHWRTYVSDHLPECSRIENGDQHVCPDALRRLLDQAPAAFTDARGWGAMMMLQPASTDGSLWVLNRLREGTGRYSSRYTPAMDAPTREWYTSHLATRSAFELDGERVELLDVHCVQGDTINVHCPQTLSVLTMPDDETDLPAHRRVRLRDLCITFDGAGGLPCLRHRDGQRYLAVNLGLAFEAYMPTLLKFLCLFGPSELGTVQPPRMRREHGPVVIGERTVVGNLVVHRRSWTISAEVLKRLLQGRDDAQTFAAINRFRMRWSIPERAFFWDMLLHDFFKKTYKPQYLDFTSPLFLPLLRGALENGEDLKLTEVLPTPEVCPHDREGRHWAVEVLLDSLALRRPHASTPVQGKRAPFGRNGPVAAGGQLIRD